MFSFLQIKKIGGIGVLGIPAERQNNKKERTDAKMKEKQMLGDEFYIGDHYEEFSDIQPQIKDLKYREYFENLLVERKLRRMELETVFKHTCSDRTVTKAKILDEQILIIQNLLSLY